MAYKFLTPEDVKAHIIDQFLNERGAETPTAILEKLELQNIEIIKTKLKGRYNVEEIFNATGDERHYLIIMILCKLVIYNFLRRNAARKVPQDYLKEWEWAMKVLEKIKAGKEVPDGLPRVEDTQGNIISTVKHANNTNEDFYI
jgi:hypothetical protein